MWTLAASALLALATPLFPKFDRQTADGALSAPRALAIAADGTIVVADSGHHRIVWLDRTGAVSRCFGETDGKPGELLFPSGVAIAPSGDVVVADTGNHRVRVLGSDGALRRSIGGAGKEPGRFFMPTGVAASADRIAVADTGNARVQILALDGAPIAASPPGALTRPVAVAIAPDGAIFVADADRHVIVALAPDGSERARFGGLGFHRGLLAEPSALALHAGALYVADSRNHRVQAFDLAGAPLGEWGQHAFEPREGAGKLHYPDALAIAPDGSFAAVGESIEDRVQLFVPLGAGETAPAAPPPGPSAVTHFGPPIAAAAGAIALVDPERDAIAVYDSRSSEPVLVTTFASAGFGIGKLARVPALALALDGRRLVAADGARRLLQVFALDRDPAAPLRFDPDSMRFAKAHDFLAGDATPVDPAAVAIDRDGRYHVLDARGGRVVVLDGKLGRVTEYGAGLEGGTGLALDAAGATAYVALPLAGVVRALDARTGAPRRDLPSDGRLAMPFGVAVSADGVVSVTDTLAHAIDEFDEHGRFLRRFGKAGVGAGEFWKPAGLARDERGRLLVVDHGNHRVQVFSPDGKLETAFGARSYVRPALRPRERD